MTNGKYFYGVEISEYGQKNGYVDYRTLAKTFNAVLNNEIYTKLWKINPDEHNYTCGNYFMLKYMNDFEVVNGEVVDEETEDYVEIFQYYIIDDNGADILMRETNEIVFYSEDLDMYLWGVTHYGTSWDYVLTDIKIDW